MRAPLWKEGGGTALTLFQEPHPEEPRGRWRLGRARLGGVGAPVGLKNPTATGRGEGSGGGSKENEVQDGGHLVQGEVGGRLYSSFACEMQVSL